MRRTVTIKLGVWYDEAEQRIKLTSRDFISSIDLDPASVRHHPHLLLKLTRLLRANGAPAPDDPQGFVMRASGRAVLSPVPHGAEDDP